MTELRFSCTGCGRCCYGGPDHFIEATAREQERIRQSLGVSPAWFRRRYVVKVDRDTEGLRIDRTTGACLFLGKDLRCRIYRVRPAQCREFPLWPELLTDRKAWLAEAKRCEGIGRGAVIPLNRVRAVLRKRRR